MGSILTWLCTLWPGIIRTNSLSRPLGNTLHSHPELHTHDPGRSPLGLAAPLSPASPGPLSHLEARCWRIFILLIILLGWVTYPPKQFLSGWQPTWLTFVMLPRQLDAYCPLSPNIWEPTDSVTVPQSLFSARLRQGEDTLHLL